MAIVVAHNKWIAYSGVTEANRASKEQNAMGSKSTTQKTLDAYRALSRNADSATHCVCGAALSRGNEMAHVSGWYGDFHLVWDRGRLLTVDACCARCRTRMAYTPQACDYDPAGDRVTYACPALRDWLGVHGGTETQEWDNLIVYARLCMRGDDRVDAAMNKIYAKRA